jgi:hypothetical protein
MPPISRKPSGTSNESVQKLLDELNRPPRFPGLKPWWLPLTVFFIGLLLYFPLRAQWVYLLDSAEFALAVRHFDVSLSQPHPPGYFLYVMLGRLANVVVGDPHVALVWLSVLCGAALAGMLAKLGTDLYGRPSVGQAAGFLAVTSPLIWFFSCVALTYVVEALLATVFVWWCWHAMRRGGTWPDVLGLGLMLALVSGVRQQSLPALLPLALFTVSQFRAKRAAKALVLIAVTSGGIGLWFSEMLAMTGGLEAYRAAAQRITQFHAHKTLLGGGGLDAVRWNFFFAAIYCLNGLMAGTVVLAAAWVGRLFRRRALIGSVPTINTTATTEPTALLAWWILPPMVLGIFVGYSEAHGHVLGYLPGLILLTGAVLGRIRTNAWRYTLVSTCCAINLFAYLGWPASWDKVFAGTTRTDRALRQHDKTIRCLVNAIQGQFQPETTRILYLNGNPYLGLRHLQWHLPQFTHVQISVDHTMVPQGQTRYLASVGGHTQLIDQVLSRDIKIILLVIPRGTDPQPFGKYVDLSRANPIEGTADTLWAVVP